MQLHSKAYKAIVWPEPQPAPTRGTRLPRDRDPDVPKGQTLTEQASHPAQLTPGASATSSQQHKWLLLTLKK